jgi:transforming growth factor-beta-induced protein
MRKLALFGGALAVAALAVMPVAAQDQTIADIVVASASAETPEFTQLLAVVSAADPSVLEALSSPDVALTVFAPTDAAFVALTEALGAEATAELLASPEVLTDILLYHVVGMPVMSGDVVAGIEAAAMFNMSLTVPTLNGQFLDIAATEEGGVTVDGANLNLEMVDIEASNGVIHVIDAVLVPEDRPLVTLVNDLAAAEEPSFTVLSAALAAAGFMDTEEAPALTDVTVFAPTDEAFVAALEALGVTAEDLLGDTELLTSILTYHVVPGLVNSGMIQAAMMEEPMDAAWFAGYGENGEILLNTLNGGTLAFGVMDGMVMVNDATVLATDVDANGALIHVIDTVLVPDMGM